LEDFDRLEAVSFTYDKQGRDPYDAGTFLGIAAGGSRGRKRVAFLFDSGDGWQGLGIGRGCDRSGGGARARIVDASARPGMADAAVPVGMACTVSG
jgi:hypothetical protein